MKRLLIIAYDFPPMLPGVRRIVAFSRYLPEFGWQPEILTVKPIWTWAYDAYPLQEFEQKQVKITRVGSWDPYRLAYIAREWKQSVFGATSPKKPQPGTAAPQQKPQQQDTAKPTGGLGAKAIAWLRKHYFCPDDHVGWVGPAVRQARAMLRRQLPDAILTTSFPHSTHLIGLQLKREFPHVPWVADFRDGWTQNCDFFSPLSPRIQARSAQLEREVALGADAIIAVSDPITAHFQRLNDAFGSPPCISSKAKRILTIANGFDPQDIRLAQPRDWGGFALVYAGTIYGQRSPEPIFQVAAEAIKSHEGLRRDLKLVFVGSFGSGLKKLASDYQLADRLIETGPLTFLESLGAQRGAGALVALLREVPNIEIVLTQKIFEYMASGRPVLALTPERSACAKLIREIGGGVVCDPEDPLTGAKALIELYEKVQGNSWTPVPAESLKNFDRRELTRQLAGVLDSFESTGAHFR